MSAEASTGINYNTACYQVSKTTHSHPRTKIHITFLHMINYITCHISKQYTRVSAEFSTRTNYSTEQKSHYFSLHNRMQNQAILLVKPQATMSEFAVEHMYVNNLHVFCTHMQYMQTFGL